VDAALPRTLRAVARASIEHWLAEGRPLAVEAAAYPAELREPGASFVTLERRGVLRGCIGSLEAQRPLVDDVALNAFGAAFRDPRFPPLAAEELPGLDVSVSVLSPLEPMAARSEAALLAQLRPGIDGLVLRAGERRATFLPAVWKELPEPAAFLRQLKRKAELGEAEWPPGTQALRYTVREAD
jgi:AmmeMemoRadiSam system protein A